MEIVGFARSLSNIASSASTWHAMKETDTAWSRSACGMYVAPIGVVVPLERADVYRAAKGTGIVGLCGVCRRSRAWKTSGVIVPPANPPQEIP